MKRKIISILITILVILAILLGSLPVKAAETYLALGDSITTGFGLADKAASFPELVAEANRYTVQNLAADGSKMADVSALVTSGRIDDAITSAQVITITCGGNDFLDILCESVAISYNATASEPIRPEEVFSILSDSADTRRLTLFMRAVTVFSGNGRGTPAFVESEMFIKTLQSFTNSLNGIVSYMRQRNEDTKIIVATQYNPYKGFTGSFAFLEKYVDEALLKLNQAIIEGAENGGYAVCDVYKAFDSAEEPLCNADQKSMNFDFHPNGRGHEVLASCMNETIQALYHGENTIKHHSAVADFTFITDFASGFQNMLQAISVVS